MALRLNNQYIRLISGILVAVFIYFLSAWLFLYHLLTVSQQALSTGQRPLPEMVIAWELERKNTEGHSAPLAKGEWIQDDATTEWTLSYNEYNGGLLIDTQTVIYVHNTEAAFASDGSALPLTEAFWKDELLPIYALTTIQRMLLAAHLRPTWLISQRREKVWQWTLRFRYGEAIWSLSGGFDQLDIHWGEWRARIYQQEQPQSKRLRSASLTTTTIDSHEMDRSLRAVVDLARLNQHPLKPPLPGRWTAGNGALRVKDGQRILNVRGTPFEMGYQHGILLAASVDRLVNRVVFGVGLYYSLSKGSWFPDDARALVERQRPFIDASYFEEMEGLAKGAGVPLDYIQMANIFPEFFHCSGVALFGAATVDGTLLHARVLDYMTHVGLQDEAVILVMEGNGKVPFVNVGFAGFIGCVTGMNANRIAIGEMGGTGAGLWDGTPMSLLVRGALEHAYSLNEVVDWFDRHPRTCEYYYVVSDGSQRDAVAMKATPDALEVVRAGESHPELPTIVADGVVLSAGRRYTKLIERIQKRYGQIDPAAMIEIIAPPVSMTGNLHNVIFTPETRALWVANAGRWNRASDAPYMRYEWNDLLESPAPVISPHGQRK